jgi:RNA-directed DNA polymerase
MVFDSSPPTFPRLKNGTDVAAMLGVSWRALRYHLFRMPQTHRYRAFAVPKRGGGVRAIEAPCKRLKDIQTSLLRVLEEIYFPRAPVHGFTFGRGIVTNARRHVGARWLLNIDLKEFFPSIHIGRVIGLFKSWPFSAEDEAATVIAQLCTCGGKLPQGAPTSPIISNMVCFKMDQELLELAKNERCTYTRYADDITFSTRLSVMPIPVLESPGPPLTLGEQLKKVLGAANFEVNATKMRLQNRKHRMVVTGLKINRFPNVRKSLISQIRAMLHAWSKFGVEAAQREFATYYDNRSRGPTTVETSFRHVLLGKLLFLGQVRGFSDKRFTRFARQLYELDPTLLPKSPAYDVSHIARAATCVLTNDDESKTGTGFFLERVGLVTCHHVSAFATRAFYPDAIGEFHSVQVLESRADIDLAICQTELSPRYALTPRFHDLLNGTGVFLHGFPSYNPGFRGQFQQGQITGKRQRFGFTRYIVSMRIVAGHSGGPLLDAYGRVVGIAATGDVAQDLGYRPEDWGVVPIRYLKHFSSVVAAHQDSGAGSVVGP